MRIRISHIILIAGITLLYGCDNKSPMANISVYNLKCEMRENPVGIGCASPELSWNLSSDSRSTKQTAYRILVASSEELLAKDSADLWDTGKSPGGSSIGVVYKGNRVVSEKWK